MEITQLKTHQEDQEERPIMPKYKCGPGDPLSTLMEECAEVIQAGCKIKRFYEHVEGMKNPETRRQDLIQEIGDVFVSIDRCVDEGLFTYQELDVASERKLARLKELFGYEPR